jgi:ribosomal protein S18 acetylase RimI-like enzyme
MYTETGPAMLLRPFEVEDVAWAAPLADRLFSPLDRGYGEAVARWAVDPLVTGWVAEAPARHPVGFLLIGQLGLLGADRPRVLEVLAIAVGEEARRTGIGRSLLARALSQARGDAGVREVRLTVAADNPAARQMFEQAGFTVDRPDDGTFPGGQTAVRMRWAPRPRRQT